MKYTDINSSLEAHITTLRGVIGALLIINLFLWYGWNSTKKDLRIHIPPDIRSGAVLKADEIRPPNVYTFAGYIFQQLNYWAEDGQKDYGVNIFTLAPYFTPRFTEYLKNDMKYKGKKGRLSGRARTMNAIQGHGYEERRVDLIDENTWIVWLDYKIKETVRGMEIKTIVIRYPIRVVRYEVDPETNPWGLALDGFGGEGPKRLTEADLVESKQEKVTTAGE